MNENIRRIAPLIGSEVELAPETLFSDLNTDSLGVYQLALDCETEFKINIVDEDLDNIRTVGEFADLVNRKIEGK